ncbi:MULTISPECIES: NAD(P)H-dependent oxidoreductase [Roseateles]|uniref:NADPH-quinone reductase n=1 Tax=Pelomonas aquatica TaxID=431058 RepID=A0ABU1Z7W7_9BURK|nr:MULTISPECIES: NAD(P)H-dependent oxidoreductase [Roseateles]KQY89249.1 dehydrogenase [Pelomonas sp. Root1444]MDR7296695.1 putative NADPH-quinone reductase [Pelomonas aquatica]
MPERIALIQAHPDPAGGHLCHALARAYADGALRAGREVRVIDVAQLDFPLLRSQKDWLEGEVPASLRPAQETLRWAQHLVFFFPLWLGDMPALLKGFLEQIARRGFAFEPVEGNPLGRKLLTGRSARVIVTMGMPAQVYRWYFRAHSVKSLERNILGFVGIGPIHETLIGGVDGLGEAGVRRWLDEMAERGAAGG